MLSGSNNYLSMDESLFIEEKESHHIFREIYGDPIYDTYEDDVLVIDHVDFTIKYDTSCDLVYDLYDEDHDEYEYLIRNPCEEVNFFEVQVVKNVKSLLVCFTPKKHVPRHHHLIHVEKHAELWDSIKLGPIPLHNISTLMILSHQQLTFMAYLNGKMNDFDGQQDYIFMFGGFFQWKYRKKKKKERCNIKNMTLQHCYQYNFEDEVSSTGRE